jgi:hypothetical protein
MALASILLAIVSVGCAAAGMVMTLVPRLGSVFSFAAPALALLGIVLGGLALSRRQREGLRTDVARAGVILSTIAFVPGVLVALTCGMCNALCATGELRMQKDVRFGVGPGFVFGPDAGAGPLAPPPFLPPQLDDAPPPQAAPSRGAVPAAPQGAGPSALPPPPLPPGPQERSKNGS